MALKGAILGDIAGSRYEFSSYVDWEHCELFADACEFTDDTVMSLAVKKALAENTSYTSAMQELGQKYPNAGYGGNFGKWIYWKNPEPYGSFGNGSAMRVSFVADYFARLKDVQEAARESAEVTHNHPEGIKGAVATANCIWMAKNGKSREEILQYALYEYPPDQYYYSGRDVAWLREHSTYDVTCQGSIPVAVRCFYESTDFESFMRNIFSIECDRDTIGAIGGGIVEEFYHGFGFDADAVLKRYLTPDLLEIVNRDFTPCQRKKRFSGGKEENKKGIGGHLLLQAAFALAS